MLRPVIVTLALVAASLSPAPAGATTPAAPAAAAPRSFSVTVSGSGSPVILIPGLACNRKVWASTVERYRAHHQLHVVTLAGFGGSPTLEGPLLPTVRSELAEYIRAQHLGRPVVVGHSLGGVLALWLAATAPDVVGAVVVVDALPFLPAARDPKATAESMRPQADTMRKMLAGMNADAFAAQNRYAAASMVTAPADVELVAGMGRASDPKAVAQAFYDVSTTDLRPLLPAIHAPALVLLSTEVGADADARSQYVPLAGAKVAVAPKAKHFIMLDDPGFFFAQLDGVVGR